MGEILNIFRVLLPLLRKGLVRTLAQSSPNPSLENRLVHTNIPSSKPTTDNQQPTTIFLFVLCTLYSVLTFSQSFPVQVIPQALPPAPIYVSDYADASTVSSPLRVQIILNDFEIANREIRLKTYFTGSGLNFQSNDIVVGATPLFLEGGIPLVLTNVELAPYFELMASDPGSAEEFFKATQILVRPGVAETQAVLSRELSAGNDEASRLFRQSTNLARNIERLRIRFSALGKVEQISSVGRTRSDLATEIEKLERNQQLTQVRLAEFPQYRAVASRFISLSDLRDNMTADEAYVRMAVVGSRTFMLYADQDSAEIYRVELAQDEIDQKVDTLRASISIFENGQYATYPFDIETGRAYGVIEVTP